MGTAAAIGRVLGGRYRVVSVLGTGSMSSVYRATQDDGPDVAVKLLKTKISHREAASERLFREARVIARLEHPGSVRLFDWGVEDGVPYVVLELMEGQSLAEVLDLQKALPVARAVAVIADVSDVLDAAHELGVVHRDLKPGNIMLVDDVEGQRVKVLDFGLARLMPQRNADETQPRELTRPGSTLGTPSYMAPEQVRGSHVDRRADVYACGVILYELVSGELPIVGETAIDTMLKQATDPPRPILEVCPELDRALASVVMRCLEKAPEARFQTASELGRALLSLGYPRRSADATATFVREPMPDAEQTSTVLRPAVDRAQAELPAPTPPAPTLPPPNLPKPRLPKPRAPRTKTQPPPPPKRKQKEAGGRPRTESSTRVQRDADEHTTARTTPKTDAPELVPVASLPEVRVVHADAESTSLLSRMPDLSEMEVTIPAHAPPKVTTGEHHFERTIPVTADRQTELFDMADWASTRKLKRVREEELPDATKPMRIHIVGPPPAPRSAPSAPPSEPGAPPSSAGGAGSASSPGSTQPPPMRGPEPSFPRRPGLPSMRPEDPSNAALAEVLSGMPNDERRWLVGAAIAGVALALLLALWLLL